MKTRIAAYGLAAVVLGSATPAAQAGRYGQYQYGGDYHRHRGGIHLGNISPLVAAGVGAYLYERGRQHGTRQRDRQYGYQSYDNGSSYYPDQGPGSVLYYPPSDSYAPAQGPGSPLYYPPTSGSYEPEPYYAPVNNDYPTRQYAPTRQPCRPRVPYRQSYRARRPMYRHKVVDTYTHQVVREWVDYNP